MTLGSALSSLCDSVRHGPSVPTNRHLLATLNFRKFSFCFAGYFSNIENTKQELKLFITLEPHGII